MSQLFRWPFFLSIYLMRVVCSYTMVSRLLNWKSTLNLPSLLKHHNWSCIIFIWNTCEMLWKWLPVCNTIDKIVSVTRNLCIVRHCINSLWLIGSTFIPAPHSPQKPKVCEKCSSRALSKTALTQTCDYLVGEVSYGEMNLLYFVIKGRHWMRVVLQWQLIHSIRLPMYSLQKACFVIIKSKVTYNT